MLGLERGLERAGINFRVSAYVEIEAFIIENLVRQMEQGVLAPAPVWSDVKTFNAEPFRNKIHGIIGGYPCQPFSVAGKQQGTEDPRHLWPYIKEIIRTVKPVWCFFENVSGHVNIGYREVRSDLQSLGFKVEEGIFSAEEVGAPHQRKRLFILAYSQINRRDSKTFTKYDGKKVDEEGGCRFNNSGSCKSHELAIAAGINRGLSEPEGRDQKNEITGSGETMAYTNSCGSGENIKSTELRTESIEQSPGNSWSTKQGEIEQIQGWPARPGEDQHEWEEPRTIESRMGYTINGYNFREDLLRMAGNAVVEQTAELAFRTLLNKFRNTK